MYEYTFGLDGYIWVYNIKMTPWKNKNLQEDLV